MDTFHGIPVSPGAAIGKVLVLRSEDFFDIPKVDIRSEEIPREIVRFEESLTKTRSELYAVRKKIAQDLGHEHSDIFSAHLLILEDRTLIEDVLSKINDEYLKERVADIKDVGRRIL